MRKYLKNGNYSFLEEEILGKGSFGKVFKGQNHLKDTSIAIKQIDLALLEKHGQEMEALICSEISVMRKFTKRMEQQPCPFLVKHEDCFRTEFYIYIIMEYCDGGNLLQCIKSKRLLEKEVVGILYELLQGLLFLQEMKIAHRDLKPENIFLAEGTYKIGDFGFSAQKQSFNEVMGTVPYMAPEIFDRDGTYTSKVDVWSLGVIAHEMLFNEVYFWGKDKWEVQKNIKYKEYALSKEQKLLISSEMERFLIVCLIKDRNIRPNAAELVVNPLFAREKVIERSATHYDDAFTEIEKEIKWSKEISSAAQQFAVLAEEQHRQTEFMQIYLLKKAFSRINMITYTVVNKQNYIGLSQRQLTSLGDPLNANKYKQLSETIQKQCIILTELFDQSYQRFLAYITKFSEEDRKQVQQIVNNQPYDEPQPQVVILELTKWVEVLQKSPNQNDLQLFCLKLLENEYPSRVNNKTH